ncbi:hypothetical protein [Burkholderia cenocepacia]|uniref:hypothetical protein n=1 Tax=Burkholderia cenocepacia TaxID=95486 RepID=UPI002B2401D9|nr:hypothetical protein [Burkholderia cenocepacia]MEB2499522.1 hypothetical protein [Burkholderia cenocepacia]MEB2557197.1 hypothetical protein [Burkholderia cenocepacia]
MKIEKRLSLLALFAISGIVAASEQTTVAERTISITDPVKINKILSEVPTVQGTLADRLTAVRLKAKSLDIIRLTDEDVADTLTKYHLKAGDSAIRIFTSGFPDGVAKVSGCALWDSPSILKHGSTYYPDDKTSNWLLTGQCSAP